MLRIVVRTDDAAMAANVGGAVKTEYRTFEIEAPELEAFLREPTGKNWSYVERQAIGIELPPKLTADEEYLRMVRKNGI